MATSSLTIGARSLDYVGGTLRIKHSYDRRCTANFAVESDTELGFQEGEPIDLKIDGSTVFKGMLFKPVVRWPGHTSRYYKVDGVCFDLLPQQRVISKSYQDTAVDVIVKDIITNILSTDGITEGSIPANRDVREAVFAYITVATALDKLAEVADSHWHIDDDKALNFGPMSLFSAPFDLTDIDEFAGVAEAARGNRSYRNKQYIRGGKEETVTRVETWLGDGEQQTFVTGFPISKQPTITVNSVSKTIDLLGIGDPGSDWFWSAGSTEITQNAADTPIATGIEIELTYIGLFDIVVVSTDQQEVERRKVIQGFGSGIVESVATDTTLKTSGAAFEFAAGKLGKFSTEGRSLTWDTELQTGLEAGQQILVDIPTRDFDNITMFIPEIEIRDRGGRVIQTVRAVEGPDDGDWALWFGRLLEPVDPISFRENIGEDQILIILASIEENWEWEESVAQIIHSCPVPATTLFPVVTLDPC